MVLDSLANSEQYTTLHKSFAKAFEYLKTTDFSTIEAGKYVIDGDNIYASVSEYTTKEKGELEGHELYIDIQYIVKGCEIIGYAERTNQESSVAYNPTKDIEFFKGDYAPIKIEAGQFVVLFPNDLHLPCLSCNAPTNVKKVVVKVKL